MRYSIKEDTEGELYADVNTTAGVPGNISAYQAVKTLSGVVFISLSEYILHYS